MTEVARPTDIYGILAGWAIGYRRFDHPAVFTCDEAAGVVPETSALHTKNLFLRDKRARRHILFVTACAATVDIRRLASELDADTLSFASSERLARFLGVTPGAVSLLALTHAGARDVEVVLDRVVWQAPEVRCHPLANTATLIISHDGIERLLSHTGHVPRIVSFG